MDFATETDEGYYMCQANNGIGTGLKKIIHINVNGAYFILPMYIYIKRRLLGIVKLSLSFSLCICMCIEPARFDSPIKNISSRRGDPVMLSCLAKGDDPINIVWSHNNGRIDLNNYR